MSVFVKTQHSEKLLEFKNAFPEKDHGKLLVKSSMGFLLAEFSTYEDFWIQPDETKQGSVHPGPDHSGDREPQ